MNETLIPLLSHPFVLNPNSSWGKVHTDLSIHGSNNSGGWYLFNIQNPNYYVYWPIYTLEKTYPKLITNNGVISSKTDMRKLFNPDYSYSESGNSYIGLDISEGNNFIIISGIHGILTDIEIYYWGDMTTSSSVTRIATEIKLESSNRTVSGLRKQVRKQAHYSISPIEIENQLKISFYSPWGGTYSRNGYKEGFLIYHIFFNMEKL